jgi:hypothetical protein
MWHGLNQRGYRIGRDRVGRLMRGAGLAAGSAAGRREMKAVKGTSVARAGESRGGCSSKTASVYSFVSRASVGIPAMVRLGRVQAHKSRTHPPPCSRSAKMTGAVSFVVAVASRALRPGVSEPAPCFVSPWASMIVSSTSANTKSLRRGS